jgi:pyruvate,orthophosphate dikinase
VKNPLLVSVRSGAKFSMPGMMDTILNLGLNDETVEGLKKRTSNGRFAYDSYRRFIRCLETCPRDSEGSFEHEFEAVKKAQRAKVDTDLDERASRGCRQYKQVGQAESRQELSAGSARAAAGRARRVFRSWRQRAGDGVSPHL